MSSERYDLQLKGGRVFTTGRVEATDIWVSRGRIAALGGDHQAHETLDVSGMLVIPGAVDMHVHFREPGAVHKEDWGSGSLSAAAGGVTTVADQPNTQPPTLDRRSFQLKLDLARAQSVVDYCINGGPGNVQELAACGARAIGEIFTYDLSPSELAQTLKDVADCHLLATVHAEDSDIILRAKSELERERDPMAYSASRPRKAELKAIETVLDLTRKGDRLHICHLSTAGGLELIDTRRKAGRKVSVEVTPHHLFFDRRDYPRMGTRLIMNPPLREPMDVEALWKGLREGSIDVLASDHAPHLPEEKARELWEVPPGVPGVETMLPIILAAVKGNLLTLPRAVEAMSTKPARLLGLENKGEIALGKDADLVVVNTREMRKIRADRLHSRAEWTPFEGKRAIMPQITLVRGRIVFDGELAVPPGFGRHLGTVHEIPATSK